MRRSVIAMRRGGVDGGVGTLVPMSGGEIIDPVCEMIVDVAEVRDQGLILEYAGREYAFCSLGCRSRFAEHPKAFVPKVEAWLARERDHAGTDAPTSERAVSAELPEIDAGLRAWYASCRCCLTDAYPRVVEVLDRERAVGHHVPAGPGICETAEANTDGT